MRSACSVPVLIGLCVLLADAQGCQALQKKPVGTATQGGYQFDYESATGNNCRLYRARNGPGKVMTPMLWEHGPDTLLDVDLADCAGRSSCPWVSSVKVWGSPATTTETVLGFGVNRDQYKEKPDAFTRQQPAEARKLLPFISSLFGSVADTPKSSVNVGVEVTSEAKRRGGPGSDYVLVYSIRLLDGSDPLRLLASRPREGQELSIVWEAAQGEAYARQLTAKNAADLLPKERNVVVEVQAKDIVVEESKVMAVYKGSRRIAATTAPAYRPKD